MEEGREGGREDGDTRGMRKKRSYSLSVQIIFRVLVTSPQILNKYTDYDSPNAIIPIDWIRKQRGREKHNHHNYVHVMAYTVRVWSGKLVQGCNSASTCTQWSRLAFPRSLRYYNK